jgi:hypothetical protein
MSRAGQRRGHTEGQPGQCNVEEGEGKDSKARRHQLAIGNVCEQSRNGRLTSIARREAVPALEEHSPSRDYPGDRCMGKHTAGL